VAREDLFQELIVYGTPSELGPLIQSWATNKLYQVSKNPSFRSTEGEIWLELRYPYYPPNQTIGSIALQAMPNKRTRAQLYHGTAGHWKTESMTTSSQLAELCIQLKVWLEERGRLEVCVIRGKTQGPLVR